jgi:hypothetical protein
VELRIEQIREALRCFTPAAINEHGFYTDPLALLRKFQSVDAAIKSAIAIIINNCWPGEDEADIAPPPVSRHIDKLRQQCTTEIRLALQNLREIEETTNHTLDSRELAATRQRLIEIKNHIEDIYCILYNHTFPKPSAILQ